MFDLTEFQKQLELDPPLSNVEVRREDGKAITSLVELQEGGQVVVVTLIGLVLAAVTIQAFDGSYRAETKGSIYGLDLDEGRVVSRWGYSKAALARVSIPV
jgi:hypothetical protein